MNAEQPRDGHGRWINEESVSLRDHFDRCLTDAERLQTEKWLGHGEAHELIALALKTQAQDNEQRLKTMNEWRGTVQDLTGRFVDRSTFEQLKTTRGDELEILKLADKTFVTREQLGAELHVIRADVRQNVVIAVAVTAVMSGLVGIILRAVGA